MGTWGNKLYQNDIALDVKNNYIELVRLGASSLEATEILIAANSHIIADTEDSVLFWLALADCQCDFGVLEQDVKNHALSCIERIVEADESCDKLYISHTELEKLKEKILSPTHSPKKIRPINLYHCEWQINDVYAYELDSQYAKERGLNNKFILFHKVGTIVYHPGHIVPIVRVKMADGSKLPKNEQEFNELKYVQTGSHSINDPLMIPIDRSKPIHEQQLEENRLRSMADENGKLRIFKLALLNTSKRVIPKKLFYIGNFENVIPPQNEYTPRDEVSIPSSLWKYFDKYFVDRYCAYNQTHIL